MASSRGGQRVGSKVTSDCQKIKVPSRVSLRGKMTDELKHLLREGGLPVSGQKAELIERLTNPDYRDKEAQEMAK